MAWIETHQTLRNHPKTGRLMRALGISRAEAIGYLCMLWWWSLDFAQEGLLEDFGPEEIAEGSGWNADDSERFIQALIKTRFLDETSEGLRVHDWDDYVGRLLDQREANRERKRKQCERKKARIMEVGNDGYGEGEEAREEESCHGDVTGTSQGRHRDVQGLPYLTEPDPTEPDPTNPTETTGGINWDSPKKEDWENETQRLFDEAFWVHYPRREAKIEAMKAFKKVFPYSLPIEQARKRFDNMGRHLGVLIAEKRERKHIPLPATFLNREDFDYPPDPIETGELEWVEEDMLAGGDSLETQP